jgi:4-diphosphocytidyl-2C-methyl-D-erythritol kinase
MKLTVRAHAKVNLDLRVLGVHPDGYHELRTVFQTIELHDTLVCADQPGAFTLKCRTPNVPLDESNPLVDLPPHFVVVVRPPFGVSTAEAYAWYDEDRAAGLRENRELQMLPVPWPSRAAQMINDLEPPVMRRHQEIGPLKQQLRDAGAMAAAMSGSGSAVFGLFRSRAAAERAVKPLSRNGARALVTRTLTRAEHERRGKPVVLRHATSRRAGQP